ncbi:uncharacterized protein LOC128990186 [Macrosteles quadrilineatus]|uniref:uncharacterized protein LOC128990186 n=1 Tax=Macrosteles quadrilineatus TaxID=74068 RepID=UPI0023E34C07|nr:uncharacterized protein LOC128990186 [Macrosteles quadrilineatus]
MEPRVILLQLASISCVLALPIVGIGTLEDANNAVVRDKREPSRSMTFSGFMPGKGLSAFATSGDFAPYGRRPWGQGESAQPSGEEHPPERGQSPWTPEDKGRDEEEEEVPPPRPGKKNKKKYNTREEDEEEYEKPGRGGNAAASFNAWFPIMLGMFPSSFGDEGGYSRGYPQQGHGGSYPSQGSGGHGPSYPSQGSVGHGPSYPSQGPNYPSQGHQGGFRYPQGGPHTTVIANSVSNGRSGVASSHAIAYGGGHNPQHQR